MQRGISWSLIRLHYPQGTWKGLIPLAAVPKAELPDPTYRALLNQKAFAIEALLRKVSGNPRFLQAIRDQTYFERDFEDWNLSQVVRTTGLTGFDLFHALVAEATPTGLGWVNHLSLTREDYRPLYDKRRSKYFDYVNGIRMKNRFPEDPQVEDTVINIRRYDGGDPITRLATLLAGRLEG